VERGAAPKSAPRRRAPRRSPRPATRAGLVACPHRPLIAAPGCARAGDARAAATSAAHARAPSLCTAWSAPRASDAADRRPHPTPSSAQHQSDQAWPAPRARVHGRTATARTGNAVTVGTNRHRHEPPLLAVLLRRVVDVGRITGLSGVRDWRFVDRSFARAISAPEARRSRPESRAGVEADARGPRASAPAARQASPAATIASVLNSFIRLASLPNTAARAAFQVAIFAALYVYSSLGGSIPEFFDQCIV
jgi:hypothetical protein